MSLLQSSVKIRPKIPIREFLALIVLLLCTTGLNLFALAENGYGNTYYAAAVKSMLTSWRNFIYLSFDPVGFVSVDKPPVGLWIQAASAKLLGFSGFSLMLPQVLAGVASVGLLYFLVRKVWGGLAGFMAAALLATSPINLVSNRSNILESLVVLSLLLASWAIFQAIEGKSLGWLLLAGLFIGLGFNIKGLEAWLVVPVFVLTYLVSVSLPWRTRLRHIGLMLLLMLGIAVAWITLVDLTPATQRPYVDSTLTNSEFDLTFNYNGLQRLFGEPSYNGKAPVIKHDKGDPGPIRLFQPPLGSQVSWFLPLALVALVALSWNKDWRQWWRNRGKAGLSPLEYSLVFWGGWLVTAGIFFSVALRFNEYYLAVLAPAVCALAAKGFVVFWQDSLQKGWRGWLLAIAFCATGTEQIIIMFDYLASNDWQIAFLSGVTAAGTLVLVGLRLLRPRFEKQAIFRIYLFAISGIVFSTLLIVPLWWVSVSLRPINSGEFPLSGPEPQAKGHYLVPAPDPQLLTYLKTQDGNELFLLATSAIDDAAAIYLATNRPTMAMGGYTGYSAILTPESLAARVARSEVHFFLIPATNLSESQAQSFYAQDIAESGRPFVTSYTNALTQWVSSACQPIAPEKWQTSPQLLKMQLFDCRARK